MKSFFTQAAALYFAFTPSMAFESPQVDLNELGEVDLTNERSSTLCKDNILQTNLLKNDFIFSKSANNFIQFYPMMFESATPEIDSGDGKTFFQKFVIDEFDNFKLLIRLSPSARAIFTSKPWFKGKVGGDLSLSDWRKFGDS